MAKIELNPAWTFEFELYLESYGKHQVSGLATIGYEYDRGEPGVHTLPNGDPGYPGTPPSVEWGLISLEMDEGYEAWANEAQEELEKDDTMVREACFSDYGERLHDPF